jgi:hypothetical protein
MSIYKYEQKPKTYGFAAVISVTRLHVASSLT